MARHTWIAAMVMTTAAPMALAQTQVTATPAEAPAAQPAPQAEPTLKVGDKAPAITIGKWVKGEPVTGYEKGRVYVIEFWATWCGPCIASMPHLTQLQKDYKGKVQIIGVSAVDPKNSLEQVEKMVREKGDGMGYAVAWDEGKKTKTALFTAAGQRGIPCSFVIDGTGTLAYVGHPMWLDIPLERITKGTWDPIAGKAEIETAQQRYKAVTSAKDAKEALNLLGAFEKDYPSVAGVLANSKYGILVRAGDARAAALGRELYESAVKAGDSAKLVMIARVNIDPKAPKEGRDLDLALASATRAVELTEGKSAGPLLILASVYDARGENEKANETRRRTIPLAKDS